MIPRWCYIIFSVTLVLFDAHLLLNQVSPPVSFLPPQAGQSLVASETRDVHVFISNYDQENRDLPFSLGIHGSSLEEVFRRDLLAGVLLARMVPSYIVECPRGHPGLTAQLVHHCCQGVPDCCCNFVAKVYQTSAPLLPRCTKLVSSCCRAIPDWCSFVAKVYQTSAPLLPRCTRLVHQSCLGVSAIPDNLLWGNLYNNCNQCQFLKVG